MDEKTLIYFPEDNYYKFFWPFFSPSALFHFSLRDNYILFIGSLSIMLESFYKYMVNLLFPFLF